MRKSRWLLVGTLSALTVALPAPSSFASSHREAPFVSTQPQLDNTDVYAFVSPDKAATVTLISNWLPFEEPTGGPNFYPFAPGAQYDINIDNNGDGVPDVIYRWTFKSTYQSGDTFLYNTGPVNSITDANLNFRQTYDLDVIKGAVSTNLLKDAPAAPSNTGAASFPNYGAIRDQAVVPFAGGAGKSFAGQADDPFFLDLRVFDLLYGTNLKEAGHDTLDGYNVNALAVQVPKNDLAGAGDAGANPIIGIWSTVQVPGVRTLNADGTQAGTGNFVQVSRLGMPLVNEVVVPAKFKDHFNASKPADDAQFLPKVQDPEVPKLIESIYKIKAPATPRDDLVSVFLTGVEGLNKPPNVKASEQLRLNMSIAPVAVGNRLGVIGGDNAGFPNGRRLSDDVVDITLQVAEGFLTGQKTGLGDGVNTNDVAFGTSFPYLAVPRTGSEAVNTKTAAAATSPAAATTPAVGTTPAGGAMPTGAVQAGAGGTSRHRAPVVPFAVGLASIALIGYGVSSRRRRLS